MPSDEQRAWNATLRRRARESERRWLVALLLSVFTGYLGLDRFYLGQMSLGLLKLATLGGGGLWWLLDILLIALGVAKDADGAELR